MVGNRAPTTAAPPVSAEAGTIRPENCVAGRVQDIAYRGDVSLYKVRLDDGATLTASLANAGRRADRAIGWDDTVWLSWAPEAGVLLHSSSGGPELAKVYARLGCHFSFAGPVSYAEARKPAESVRRVLCSDRMHTTFGRLATQYHPCRQ